MRTCRDPRPERGQEAVFGAHRAAYRHHWRSETRTAAMVEASRLEPAVKRKSRPFLEARWDQMQSEETGRWATIARCTCRCIVGPVALQKRGSPNDLRLNHQRRWAPRP